MKDDEFHYETKSNEWWQITSRTRRYIRSQMNHDTFHHETKSNEWCHITFRTKSNENWRIPFRTRRHIRTKSNEWWQLSNETIHMNVAPFIWLPFVMECVIRNFVFREGDVTSWTNARKLKSNERCYIPFRTRLYKRSQMHDDPHFITNETIRVIWNE